MFYYTDADAMIYVMSTRATIYVSVYYANADAMIHVMSTCPMIYDLRGIMTIRKQHIRRFSPGSAEHF